MLLGPESDASSWLVLLRPSPDRIQVPLPQACSYLTISRSVHLMNTSLQHPHHLNPGVSASYLMCSGLPLMKRRRRNTVSPV